MSELHDDSITIFEAINNIENGKYVMPAFQRQFVWTMSQIEKLWDSILLDYPIATFLFWKVDDSNITWDTYFCTFLGQSLFLWDWPKLSKYRESRTSEDLKMIA